jgi:hypothetical protein
MSFKYINPGYANLLDVDGGTTITDDPHSKTGVSFYQPTVDKGIAMMESLAELYGKFDVYLPNGDNSFSITIAMVRANGYTKNGIGFEKIGDTMYFMRYYNGNSSMTSRAYTSSPEALNIKPDAINTFWFHVKSGSDGFIEIYSNGVSADTFSYAIDFATSPTLAVYVSNAYGAISNLILSDAEIHKREQVVILPVSATETTMTAGKNGNYIAGADGQTILQTVDTASLIADYGADSDIRGIAVIGNPAYRTAEGLSMLTALEKVGDTLTEYGTRQVNSSADAGVLDSRAVSMKLSALADYQFGWKAGVGS